MISKLLIPEWSVTNKGIASSSYLMRFYKLTDKSDGQVGFVPNLQDALKVRKEWLEKSRGLSVDIEPIYLPVSLENEASTLH